jgi:subtilisin family serine protease
MITLIDLFRLSLWKANYETIYQHYGLRENSNYMLTYTEPSRREGTPIPRSPDFSQEARPSDVLDLVKLTPLIELTSGRPEIVIGLVDGPVVIDHPDLTGENVREIPGRIGGTCARATSLACMHGTFVAGILSAKRSSAAPAICPGCTLLVRPIFPETPVAGELIPSAMPEELAAAIIECIDAGARLVNLSAALAQVPSAKGERALGQALDHAANSGVIVVAAAGNPGTDGSTVITRHQSVIAVIGCNRRGRPLNESNFGNSIGRRGLSAPGEGITSLGTFGDAVPSGGTSVAAPFVTGAIALVWSEFPSASAGQVRLAVTQAHAQRRPTVVPVLLNACAIHAAMREFRSL